jgi:hypothetical protein
MTALVICYVRMPVGISVAKLFLRSLVSQTCEGGRGRPHSSYMMCVWLSYLND